jgi:hypothetical protein
VDECKPLAPGRPTAVYATSLPPPAAAVAGVAEGATAVMMEAVAEVATAAVAEVAEVEVAEVAEVAEEVSSGSTEKTTEDAAADARGAEEAAEAAAAEDAVEGVTVTDESASPVISPAALREVAAVVIQLAARVPQWNMDGRGLHSSTFRLNVSAFSGIGGVFRGYVGGVWVVSAVIRGCLGCILCHKRLRLS